MLAKERILGNPVYNRTVATTHMSWKNLHKSASPRRIFGKLPQADRFFNKKDILIDC